MRLIDADALVKHAKRMYTEGEAWQIAPVAVKAVETYDIQRAPTIDAVPVVHARWEHGQRYGDSGGWVWRCTACGREAISPIISALKYCHSCGAKMDAKEC